LNGSDGRATESDPTNELSSYSYPTITSKILKPVNWHTKKRN
jgi:hypothetical protein